MSLRDRLTELVSYDTQNPSGRERPLCDKLAADLRALGAAAVEVADVDTSAGRARVRLRALRHRRAAPAAERARRHRAGQQRLRHAAAHADRAGRRASSASAAPTPRARSPPSSKRWRAAGPRATSACCSPATRSAADRACAPFSTARTRAASSARSSASRPAAASAGATAASAPRSPAPAGPGGHSSRVDGIDNPIAILARAAVALDDFGREQRDQGPEGFRGICLNVAALDGGIAFNVIPTRATLSLSLRPAPGTDVGELLEEAGRRARAAVAPRAIEWEVRKENPAFATRDIAAFEPLLGARARQPVDLAFWTEAALLSEAGIDAVVFGPGDIAQAHAADEFVTMADLEAAQAAFEQVLAATP